MTDREPPSSTPAEAVRKLVRIDPTFAHSPDRLARALRDLLPHDERAVHLLSTAARLGVPAMLAAGTDAATEAGDRLIDLAGLRPELAAWVVDTWRAAFGLASTDRPVPWRSLPTAGTGGDGSPAHVAGDGSARHGDGERIRVGPVAATAIDVATLADGSAVVVVLSPEGVFVTVVGARASTTTRPRWRRAATPGAPNSRDVAACAAGGAAMIAWTDTGGLFVRGASPDASSIVALTEPHLVALGPSVEPRFPLAAHATDGTTVDLIWTADRRRLGRRTVREWLPVAEPADLTSPVEPGERLRRLDVAAIADGAFVAAVTDRGRLLLARWHAGVDVVSGWTAVATPAPVGGVTVTTVGTEPVVIAAAVDGRYLCADPTRAMAGDPRWRPVARVGGAPGVAGTVLLAGSASAAGTWLAACTGDSGWLHRVGWRDGAPVTGPEVPLWGSRQN